MGFDSKYGQVMTEQGDIPDDEPVMVFRGRDFNMVKLLQSYYILCKNSGSPQRHLDMIQKNWEDIKKWQEDNIERVRIPDSEASREWLEK